MVVVKTVNLLILKDKKNKTVTVRKQDHSAKNKAFLLFVCSSNQIVRD